MEESVGLEGLAFTPESARPPPEGSLLEHELGCWIDGPVVTFARATQSFGQLDETLVQTQIVAY